MQNVAKQTIAPAQAIPSRLHHTAWVIKDQARTRAFYEDALGFTMTAFWIEKVRNPDDGDIMTFSHAFYSLTDGSALAFFCMAEPKYQERFKSPVIEVFNHVALNVDDRVQVKMRERLEAAGEKHNFIDHGYCRSLYVVDPDGFRLEFTVDAPDVERINREQARDARMWYDRWNEGHREANNHLFTNQVREGAVT